MVVFFFCVITIILATVAVTVMRDIHPPQGLFGYGVTNWSRLRFVLIYAAPFFPAYEVFQLCWMR